MDAFVEKIVARKKKAADYAYAFGVVLASFAAAFAVMALGGSLAPAFMPFWLLLAMGALYLGFRLQQRIQVEYEYILTNDQLDVDKIVARRKRTRVFSADVRQFESVGLVRGQGYGPHVAAGAATLFCGSEMGAEGLWFATLPYKGRKTVLYFEPDARMVDCFKRFIPKKIQA